MSTTGSLNPLNRLLWCVLCRPRTRTM